MAGGIDFDHAFIGYRHSAGDVNDFAFNLYAGKLSWWDEFSIGGKHHLSSAYLADGKWKFVTASRQGNEINLFESDRFVSTQVTGTGAIGSAFLDAGRSLWTGITTFKGSIDEVRIYDRALSASEVSALYALERPVSPAPSAPAHSLTFSLEDANGSQVLSSAPVDPGELSSSGGWLRASVGSQPVARSPSRSLAGGLDHSVFIKSDGSLWGVGCNQYGQLGLGDTVDRNTSVQIVSSGVIQVSSGSGHVLFLKEDGSLGHG